MLVASITQLKEELSMASFSLAPLFFETEVSLGETKGLTFFFRSQIHPPGRRDLVLSSPPATEETGAMGR
jgi:hypothetical protein